MRSDSGSGVAFLPLLRPLTNLHFIVEPPLRPSYRLCNSRWIEARKAQQSLASPSVSVISNSVNQKVSRPQEQSNPPSPLPPPPYPLLFSLKSAVNARTHAYQLPENCSQRVGGRRARTVCLPPSLLSLLPKYHLRVKLSRAARDR